MTLTRQYRFSASHRLHSPEMSADVNAALYGKCNNPHGHGHNYAVEISVAGRVDPRTGLLVNIHELDKLVQNEIVSRYDHKNLNVQVAELAGLVPTTEVVTKAIRQRLLQAWPFEKVLLERVRIYETRNNIFEVGDEIQAQ